MILIPRNSYMGKTDTFGRLNNTELLMLVLDFKVDYRLKNTQRFQWNAVNALSKNAKKNDTFCTSGVGIIKSQINLYGFIMQFSLSFR